jgi:hypothetical protein
MRRRRSPSAEAGSSIGATLRHALGDPPAPKSITQVPFDHDDSHYARLCAAALGETKASGRDLIDYALDITYQPLQRDLFVFLLPLCIEAWRDELLGHRRGYGGFVEQLYPALVRSRCLETQLPPEARDAVVAAMRAAIVEAIDRERQLSFEGMGATPYRWVGAFVTHGGLAPDIDALWAAWWELGTPGRAVAALQLASCLMYDDRANPVFAAWTPERGGGPPSLWQYAGHLYEDRWLPENVSFLERTLDATYIGERVEAAAAALAGEPTYEMARAIAGDLGDRRELLAQRCEELPRMLATPGTPGEIRRWSL